MIPSRQIRARAHTHALVKLLVPSIRNLEPYGVVTACGSFGKLIICFAPTTPPLSSREFDGLGTSYQGRDPYFNLRGSVNLLSVRYLTCCGVFVELANVYLHVGTIRDSSYHAA